MSMSLSRQSQCGFEVDLLYFFLGCLIVLLMKIKLQLFILGAGISYSLIIIRSFITSINTTAENEYLEHRGENSVVIEMNSLLQPSNDFSRMTRQFASCTNALQQENLNLIDRLMDLVKEYNQDMSELHLLGKCEFVMDTLPSGKIHNLHEIVRLMVTAGYEKECCDLYSSWRGVFLQEFLINKIFGLPEGKINAENEHEREQYLDTMFQRWITSTDVAMKILFPIEQKLCNRVFSGLTSAASHCFIEVCQKSMFQLLDFADAVTSGVPTKWRLFKMLDVFEQLRNLIPKLQSLFPDSILLNEATAVQNRLGEASRDLILMEMQNIIFRDPKLKQVASLFGPVHPMTVEVMSYVSSACRSRQKMVQILREYRKVDNEVEASSFFLKTMEQILGMLERKLIALSKKYKDKAWRHIFMLNNRSHIEAMKKSWELETILGNNCFQNNKEKIQQNLELYKQNSWNEVLEFLKLDNNEKLAVNDNITEEVLKEQIHLFNSHFEKICRIQSTWFVYEKKPREEIITYVGNILLPAYGFFIGRLQDILGNQAYKYIKFGMFEIQDQLNHLFMGNQNI